jgi:hypothetical protein
MKKNYSKFLLLSFMAFGFKANAQCTSCTTTISGADASPHLVTSGQTLCVTSTGSLTGLIEVDAGGMLCNSGTINSTNVWLNGGGLTNYATCTVPDILVSSGGTFTNSGLIGNTHFMVETGGHFVNSGSSNSIDSLLVSDAGSTFSNTGNLVDIRLAFTNGASGTNNGTISVQYMGDSATTTFTNNGDLTVNVDFGIASNSIFTNNGYMKIMRDFGNSGSSVFQTDCMITVGRDWYNSATISAPAGSCGGFNIASTSLNSGTIGSSTQHVDICDAGHPTGGLDGNSGTIASTTTYCTCTNSCTSTVGVMEIPAQSNVLINSVYPNPASSAINVSLNAKENETLVVEVLDMVGKKQMTTSLKANAGENKTSVDVSSLAKGAYILRITDAKNLQVVKMFNVVR